MRKLFAFLALLWCLPAHAQPVNLGDYVLGDTVRCPWSTYKPSTGDSVARATAGTVTVYHDNGAGNGYNTTPSATGVTDTNPFNSKTGQMVTTIVASGANGYASGTDYVVAVEGTTITDTATVTVNAWPCVFSVENRFPLKQNIAFRGTAVAFSANGTVCFSNAAFSNNGDGTGMTLWNRTKNEKYVITGSTASTHCVTIVPNQHTQESVNDVLQIMNDDPQFAIDVVGGATTALSNYFNGTLTATGGTNFRGFYNNNGAGSGQFVSDIGTILSRIGSPIGASMSADIANVPTAVGNLNVDGTVSARCVWAQTLSVLSNPYTSTSAATPYTTTFRDPTNAANRLIATTTSTSRTVGSVTCPP
jgi:hypothetical protein